MNIISGMGGLFRAEILRRLEGFDTGLGDDRDLTMMLRKQRWKLSFSVDAVVWTTVPVTRDHLWRQRARWRRNVMKICVSKHRDQFVLGRYRFANAYLAMQVLLGRMLIPFAILIGLFWAAAQNGPLSDTRNPRNFLLDNGHLSADQTIDYARCCRRAKTDEFLADVSVSILRNFLRGPSAVLCRGRRAVSDWRETPLRSGPYLGRDPVVVTAAVTTGRHGRKGSSLFCATVLLAGIAIAPTPTQSAGSSSVGSPSSPFTLRRKPLRFDLVGPSRFNSHFFSLSSSYGPMSVIAPTVYGDFRSPSYQAWSPSTGSGVQPMSETEGATLR